MGKLTSIGSTLSTIPNRLSITYTLKGDAQARRKLDNSGGRNKTARWQKLRQKILKRDKWTCQQTGVLVIGKYPSPASAVCDHIIPHRGDDDLFWDESNLQIVSKEYHDKEKQKMEAAGLY